RNDGRTRDDDAEEGSSRHDRIRRGGDGRRVGSRTRFGRKTGAAGVGGECQRVVAGDVRRAVENGETEIEESGTRARRAPLCEREGGARQIVPGRLKSCRVV